MAEKFEEQYGDVLQNIEMALVSVYREYEEMTDYGAQKALDVLIAHYKAEAREREPRPLRLEGAPLKAYERMQVMCQWRLGYDVEFTDTEGNPVQIDLQPITIDETIACLKRIGKSVRTWNKRGGRRGYFFYIDQFIT